MQRLKPVNGKATFVEGVEVLRPVTSYLSVREHAKASHYFFTTDKGYLVKWSVDSNNKLFSLVSGLYTQSHKCPITIAGHYQPMIRQLGNELHYLSLSAPEIIFK